MKKLLMFLFFPIAILFGGLFGCGQLKEEGRAVARDVVDCTTSSALQAIDEYGPTVKQVLLDSIDGAGKIDKDRVKSVAKSYATESARCVLAATIARLLSPPAPKADAPQSSPHVVDLIALEELRKEQLGDVRYKLPGGATL